VSALDFSYFFLWVGDLCFIAGLILMALISASAGLKIERGARVPMQFGIGGKPTWTAPRRLALLFAPSLAAGFGLLLAILAHQQAGVELSSQVMMMGSARVLMAFFFVVAHLLHLIFALKWLNRAR
jgi:hypothetical protein